MPGDKIAALESGTRWAVHVARTHCPIAWPHGVRSLNCGAAFPCDGYEQAFDALADTGWSAAQIEALDVRTGPWS
jgi:hypothetical protein